jgi:hypothetical protein
MDQLSPPNQPSSPTKKKRITKPNTKKYSMSIRSIQRIFLINGADQMSAQASREVCIQVELLLHQIARACIRTAFLNKRERILRRHIVDVFKRYLEVDREKAELLLAQKESRPPS